MSEAKECRACWQLKPLRAFNRNHTYRDGYENQCRECVKAKRKRWESERRPPEKAPKEARCGCHADAMSHCFDENLRCSNHAEGQMPCGWNWHRQQGEPRECGNPRLGNARTRGESATV